MNALLIRIRGALGLGVTWSVAWAVIFAAISLIIGVFDPDSIDPGEGPLSVARIGAVFGFVSGAAFSTLLAVAERGKEIRELSIRRVALWGAIAAAAFPLLTAVDNSTLVLLCPIGAVVAAASVAVAKRQISGGALSSADGKVRAVMSAGPTASAAGEASRCPPGA